MNINIREFDNTESDYQTIVDIGLALFPDMGGSVEMWQYRDEVWDQKFYSQRLMLEVDGKVAGYTQILEPPWSYKEGKYNIFIAIYPDCQKQGLGSHLYDYCLEYLASREPKPTLISTSTREDKQDSIRFLEKRDFQWMMRFERSRLDVTDFDFEPYAALREKVSLSGIRIITLAELEQDDPENYLKRLMEPWWAIVLDVPGTDEPQKPSLEVFTKWAHSPDFLKDAYFLAMDGDEVVGLSMLMKKLGSPEKLNTGLTGTVPAYRRRGIATALKMQAIAFAQAYGAQFIETDNEENNPMYQINLQLGFQPIPAWLEYHKAL